MKDLLLLNIQKFSLHDGPGLRTIVFFKGCPLRCKWCSNPESQSTCPELLYYQRLCIKCYSCEKICPLNAIAFNENGINIDRLKCVGCGHCVKECPSNALAIVGKSSSIESIMDRVLLDRHYYENSGGGITLSGGEPLNQPEAALALLDACKREGLHTVVETCGHVKPVILRDAHGLVDIFLYDIKEIEPAQHKFGTGMTNDLILTNLTELVNLNAEIVVRVPLIPTFNMHDSFYYGLISLVKRLGLSQVEIIPYHRLGLAKYDALGRNNELATIPPLDEKICQDIARLIRDQTEATVTVSH